MKIDGKGALTPLAAPRRDAGSARSATSDASGGAPAVKASLSNSASFVQSMREESSASGPEEPFRPNVVERMRSLLDSGKFDESFDLDQVADSVMADL